MPSDLTAAAKAFLRITRTLVYDDHPSAGGMTPKVDLNSMRVVFSYQGRAVATQPLVRTYTVRISVPSSYPCSWEINPGDDYRLLIVTRGFSGNSAGLKIDGKVKSNYQIQLDQEKGPMGPNSFGFAVQAVGERSAVQVMRDESLGRVFQEFDETVIEALTDTPVELAMPGIVETEEAQQRRWDEWAVIRKQGLR